MYCLRCLYPLFSLRSQECPECGRPFDPLDPASYRSRGSRPFMERVAVLMRIGIVVSIAVAIAAVVMRPVDLMYMGRVFVRRGFLIYGVSLLCALGLTLAQYRTLKAVGVARWCLGMDIASIMGWCVTWLLVAVR